MTAANGERWRIPGTTRVLLLTLGVATLALALTRVVAGWQPLDSAPGWPWWTLVPGIYIAEITVVHFRGRRDAHSFSMSEIPLVLGLYLYAPADLILAVLVGSALVLSIHRRQPVLKLLFNVAQFTLVFTVALMVFRAVLRDSDPLGVAGWAGALAGNLAGLAVAILLVNVAIWLVSGMIDREGVLDVAGLSTLATVMNASLALIAVTMARLAPGMALLAVIPPAVLFLAYRAYMAQREQRTRLETLYEATRVLHETPQIEEDMAVAAGHARAMFEAEFAEITLFSGGLDEPAYRTTIGPAEARTVMHMLVLERERSFWDDFFRNRSTRLLKGSHLPAEREIGSPIAHEAIISPLVVDDEIGGVVLVANRLDDVSSFRERDGKLLETFARQISVSLENGHLVDSLAQLTELKEELRHQAMHDSLTGLANRANFRDRVVEALEDDPAGVAVLFLDLDDFKTVNDSLGHAAGDQLLMVASDRLRSHAGAGDLVARLGGDEFAILITALREDPEELARRIIQSLEAPVTIDGRNLVARASIGIACGKPGLESGQLLRNADAAMYAAKHHGKGTFRSYEDSMHEEISRILELRATLKDAVRRDELELVYQPVVDLHSGYAVGFESLLRWNHPDKGIIPPAQFVPYAEETGLIVQLGRWALLEACREARRWQDQPEARTVGVAVNISPIQLQESNVVEDVASALAETGLDPDRLTLEITENVLMHTSVVRLEELKDLGVRLAIDDFGTGYSSLSYLDRLPIDVVKIDRTFVERLGRGETSLVRTVLTIGNTLGLGSVVEGVETKPQLDRLRQLGCHHAQGFYLSMPLPANQAREVLNRRLLPADDSDLATITQLPGSA